jgi:SprT-like family protein
VKRVRGESAQLFLLQDQLPVRLQSLGLRDVERVVTHTNRSVMLSLQRRVLRIHRGYASAPDPVLRAIVRFLNPRVPRAQRRAAEREFLQFPVEEHAPHPNGRVRRERPRPGDVVLLHRLETLHCELNGKHFGAALGEISIRLSGRMKRRLGELSVDVRTGRPLELSISRRHLARDSWAEVEHTLLHEMVHQWQAEAGLQVDHGPTFRRKAREVGALPAAKRTISPDERRSIRGAAVVASS